MSVFIVYAIAFLSCISPFTCMPLPTPSPVIQGKHVAKPWSHKQQNVGDNDCAFHSYS
jgi:hypothetical protein